jgi:hypothetical protein
MNDELKERVKTLAEAAHNAVDEEMNDDRSLMGPEAWTDRMYTLFAQAVARDCAEIVLGHRKWSPESMTALILDRYGLSD